MSAQVNLTENKYQRIIELANAIDSWRIFPRIFITVYITLLYQSVHWFMSLDEPTTQQASLISIMTGIGAVWFQSYVSSKREKTE